MDATTTENESSPNKPVSAPTVLDSREPVPSIEAMNDVPGMMSVSLIVLLMLLPVVPSSILALVQYHAEAPSSVLTMAWGVLILISVVDWIWLSAHMMIHVRQTSTLTRIAGGVFIAWGMLLINVSLVISVFSLTIGLGALLEGLLRVIRG